MSKKKKKRPFPKTLVIHPEDPTTDFLKEMYKGIECSLIDDPDEYKINIISEIKKHDRIIMCGHGCPEGLFGGISGLIIDSEIVPYLKGKELICIWCHANEFVKKYKLKNTFHSGMFISEVSEARYYNINASQSEINQSNYLFSTMVGASINNNESIEEIFKNVKKYYDFESEVVRFNNDRLGWRRP